MTKEKFTKGDWVINEIGDVVVSRNRVEFHYVAILNDVDCDFADLGKNSTANAHLIAAAPDMYGMLDDIAISMECEHGVDTNAIFALLAKARGEL